jgi:hypothetical protein
VDGAEVSIKVALCFREAEHDSCRILDQNPFERLDLTKNLNKMHPTGIPIWQAVFRTLLDRDPYTQGGWSQHRVLFDFASGFLFILQSMDAEDKLGKCLFMFRLDSNLISGRTERLLREDVPWLAVGNSLISVTPRILPD